MKLIVKSKNQAVKGYIRDDVEKRFNKLGRFFSDDTTAYVTFSIEGIMHKIEITVNIKNTIIRCESKDKEIFVAIDKTIDILERQLIKNREKLKSITNDSIRFENIKEEEMNYYNIVKVKKFDIVPMSADEACFKLELLDHKFYLFENIENSKLSVIYKRDDGDYGLIEPQ